MNELEENIYGEIKKELIQNVIDKKVDTYFINKNELTHYYNVGKMIVDAQGGEEKAKYGDGLIKKISERLTMEIGKGYSIQNLKSMRRFFLYFQKRYPVGVQFSDIINWSHYRVLIPLKDFNEIDYYINEITAYHWSKRELQKHIKNKDYQRLDDKTKNKLINKNELNVYDNIKNPIYINTYNGNFDKENIEEKALKSFILRDMDNFLLQLGTGFSYISNEYKIMIGKKYNYIDILLFNYMYNCFVVVELKIT